MNKEQLIKKIANSTNCTQKVVLEVINNTIEIIQNAVKEGERVTLVGFGTFEKRNRAERKGRNPQTGEVISIPAKTVPAFSAGKNFRNIVNS